MHKGTRRIRHVGVASLAVGGTRPAAIPPQYAAREAERRPLAYGSGDELVVFGPRCQWILHRSRLTLLITNAAWWPRTTSAPA